MLNAIYPLIQVPIREAAATYTLEEIIKNRDALPELVRAAAVERLGLAGIKLIKVAVRDIMIAKELRDAYAASAIAQKTSAATLERARGEVAAMRALANAARMAQGNPELMQLRALQAMQSANGGRQTIVFDFSGKAASAAHRYRRQRRRHWRRRKSYVSSGPPKASGKHRQPDRRRAPRGSQDLLHGRRTGPPLFQSAKAQRPVRPEGSKPPQAGR